MPDPEQSSTTDQSKAAKPKRKTRKTQRAGGGGAAQPRKGPKKRTVPLGFPKHPLSKCLRIPQAILDQNAGAQACDLDLDGAAHAGQVIGRAFELAFPAIELAVDGGDRQVLGREADVGVSGIEFVLDHLVLLEIGLPIRTTCVRKQLFQEGSLPTVGG